MRAITVKNELLLNQHHRAAEEAAPRPAVGRRTGRGFGITTLRGEAVVVGVIAVIVGQSSNRFGGHSLWKATCQFTPAMTDEH